jgi:phosphatidylserine/phosphatidylglycerophosphate/cardiolipin synthase-like enzyme
MKFLASLIILLTSQIANAGNLTNCTVYFSPQGGTTEALVKYINTANRSIRMLAYNFTSQDIANALVVAKRRGVDVELILDKSVPTERNSALPTVLRSKILTWIDHKHQIAHNKVILIDDDWVETGSFNYTLNAENRNGENALICQGKEIHDEYLDNWNLHWTHSVKITKIPPLKVK